MENIQNNSQQHHSKKDLQVLLFCRKLCLIFYSLLCFFKETTGDADHIVTITIGTIPLLPYSILETILIIILAVLSFSVNKFFRKQSIICQLLGIIIISFNITYWSTSRYISFGLILRPIYISIYSNFIKKAMITFFRILYQSRYYLLIMWMFLVIYSSYGMKLYKALTLKFNQVNMFNDFWDTLYGILVTHTTANYPDVGLPFQQYYQSNVIFFLCIIITNTMIINNIIIAKNYNNYKQISQEQKDQKSLIKLQSQILRHNQKKTKQIRQINQLMSYRRLLHKIFSSPIYRGFEWLFITILFFVICLSFQDLERRANALIFYNAWVFIVKISKIYIYSFWNWKQNLLRQYRLISSIATIICFALAFRNRISYEIFLNLVILQVPVIADYVFRYFIEEVTQAIYHFLTYIQQIGIILFIISLFFAGIGQFCFGGYNTIEKYTVLAEAGVNPRYVYVNFNNTLNSFVTLFALMIVNNWMVVAQVYEILCGSRLIRLFFICFYTFGHQIAYNLILASTIEYISEEKDRFDIKKKIKQDQKKYDCEIRNLHFDLIKLLKSAYPENIQVFTNFLEENHSENFPEECISSEIMNGQNAYSLHYFISQDNENMTFEAATQKQIFNKKIQNTFVRLKKWILNVSKIQIQQISVNKILLQQIPNIDFQNKEQFKSIIQSQLKRLDISVDSGLQFNNIKQLVIYYLKQHKSAKNIFLLKYDIPQHLCRGIQELYINHELVGSSFRYWNQNYIVQKIKVIKICKYLVKFVQKNAESKDQKLNEKTEKSIYPTQTIILSSEKKNHSTDGIIN